MTQEPILAVGAIITDNDGRLLLVQRAHDPGRDLWSLPGGHVEVGETLQAALVREVREETGLEVVVGAEVGTVELPAAPGVQFEVHDFTCTLLGGELRAGDDAAEVRWVSANELTQLSTTAGLVQHLQQWHVIPD
jgi:8-oxo-dGTP diphosphatase